MSKELPKIEYREIPEVSKNQREQQMNVVFKGKDKMGEGMENAVWTEFFEAILGFEENEDEKS